MVKECRVLPDLARKYKWAEISDHLTQTFDDVQEILDSKGDQALFRLFHEVLPFVVIEDTTTKNDVVFGNGGAILYPRVPKTENPYWGTTKAPLSEEKLAAVKACNPVRGFNKNPAKGAAHAFVQAHITGHMASTMLPLYEAENYYGKGWPEDKDVREYVQALVRHDEAKPLITDTGLKTYMFFTLDV